MLLHSVLAYAFEEQSILGLAYGHVIVRDEPDEPGEPVASGASGASQKKPKGGSKGGPGSRGRASTVNESRAWEQASYAVGAVPADSHSQWIHVSDRESDVFEYMSACTTLGKDFVIRAFQNRKITPHVAHGPNEELTAVTAVTQYLMTFAREFRLDDSYDAHDEDERTYTVDVAATVKHGVTYPKRVAQMRLAWTQVQIPAPSYVKKRAGTGAGSGAGSVNTWIIRAWEDGVDVPQGAEPVEWILLTSIPVASWDEARHITQVYECRWLIEDYHQCLKTGCRMENSQLDDGSDLQRLLGFNALIALRLMQLRQVVRTAPDTAASALNAPNLDPLMIQILAARFKLDERSLTVKRVWMLIAQLGGHLGRKSESAPSRGHGSPGWRTLWKGWRHLADWAEGVRLLAPT